MIGIIGSGRIAHTMALTLLKAGLGDKTIVSSRDYAKAKAIKDEYFLLEAKGSYDEIFNDERINLVYICTINSTHYELAKRALLANKNVLIEKPITTDVNQALELSKLAKERNLFLCEALWTAFMPSRSVITKYILKIGAIKEVEAKFSLNLMHDERIVKKELGGGILYDLGVYPISMILRHFSKHYSHIESIHQVKNEDGCDIENVFSIEYDNFSCKVTVEANGCMENYILIHGSNGTLKIYGLNCPSSIELYDNNYQLVDTIDVSPWLTGFEYEVFEALRCIEKGILESSLWTHKDAIDDLRIIEDLLDEI